jgi:hypothetical protein
MPVFIDIDAVITMFKSTYRNSYLRGDEIARIIGLRYGQQEQKSSSYARNGQNSGQLQDGLPED